MYSDMSMRISAVSSSNRNSASALVSSVLPTPVGPEEHERADRAVRVLQSGAGAPHRGRDRLHRLVLADHALADLLLHFQQLLALAFEHAVDRDAGPARHDLRDVVGGDRLLDDGAGILALDVRELLLKIGDAAIGELSGALILAAPLRLGELDAKRIELGLELLRVRQLVLFRLPARRKVGRLLLQRDELAFELLQPLLGAGIAFLLQRLLLDLEPHHLAVDRIELVGLGIDLHLQPRRGLIDQVDRLVRQEAVSDVAVRQASPPTRSRRR